MARGEEEGSGTSKDKCNATSSSGGNGNSNGNGNNGGEVTAFHDLIAGGVAGSASVVIGHPFDTIKVRMQTSSLSSPSSSSPAAPASPAKANATSYYSNYHSLFKGMAAPLSTAAVVNAIIFATYGSCTRLWENLLEDGRHNEEVHGAMTGEGALFIDHAGDEHAMHEQAKDWDRRVTGGVAAFEVGYPLLPVDSEGSPSSSSFQRRLSKRSPTGNGDGAIQQNQDTCKVFVCGAAAGTVQAFVICPMEHIKCRLQVQQSLAASSAATITATITAGASATRQQLYKGPFDACISITRRYGLFSGLYRGMSVTLWRETPAFGMYFATYDAIKSKVESLLDESGDERYHHIPSHARTWAASALAGGISGALTWAIIYPFDVIKTRIQTGPLERELRRGMWTVARDIVEEHGWRHMFRGLGVTLARAFPVNAIIFPVYEFVLVQLGD
eukprot:CAMPEP_0172566908 /NCGR_PEP_ID=MMETSP1067-20121228/113744_1 /TAXON_ID=265564 ORGANISM="Thalassiosira punctigera, Strain Tpunct2005C2" /NCGR_SAMPLE_ID=MMETSP1067 /ASSEMBLY_ACC=CAM_ASM_000444 /LENGTH=443 /DNA_ID=CAMNT_0013358137 /DNA_START=93 /DNA_END=1424 /DNA_ORIENTATION=+